MLILSRRRDEKVVLIVGKEEIEILVVDIRGEKVRLGINAPAHIPVHRGEVLAAIKRERGEGATIPSGADKVQNLAERRPDPDQAAGLRILAAAQQGEQGKSQ